MNSKDLWKDLESKTNEEIQVEISASVVYLIKKRNMKLKEILKDIKNITKMLGGK